MLFTVFKTNRFGDKCYIENSIGTFDEKMIMGENFWTIHDPSQECVDYFTENLPGCGIRDYNNIPYLLSPTAFEKLPEQKINQGSACIITFQYKGIMWYLLVSDNKPYIQNCCGMAEESETPKQCMIRELKEELAISEAVSEKKITEKGYWSFIYSNELVSASWPVQTTLFHLHLSYFEIAHLITDFEILSSDVWNSIKINDVDEIDTIFIIPEHILDEVEEILNGKTFNNHHRCCLHHLSGIDYSEFNISYLNEFHIE